ncbi:polyprenol reductase [Biomphalaria pfeifferi]|uniref:Polyprenal reductase n=1 Tax=Biomphalaria pfeifferi TaxID=112525 RepID=A0AAD8F183_BIOPF|nr:polyprenol reductase [Biomphalaria pfeifferi]
MISGINILSLLWLLVAIGIFCAYLLFLLNEDLSLIILPVKSLFLFGKCLHRHSHINKRADSSLPNEVEATGTGIPGIPGSLSVPKSWFKHFYITGIICHSLAFIVLVSCLFGGPGCVIIKDLQYWVIWHSLYSAEYKFDDSALPVLLVFLLEWLQIFRRAYECFYVSSFSKSTINISHYIIGLCFYSLFGIGLLISLPLEKLAFSTPNVLEVVRYIIAVAIFVWAFHFQHRSMLTLASLRQEQKDKPPDGHFVPHGHLFDLVSSPHYLCEVIIYTAFCFMFKFENMYLNCVAVFVWTNQVIESKISHKWYTDHFPNYPAHRKTLIPYLW